LFKRWFVVYKHDNSPIDGAVFIHKDAALKFLSKQPNAVKLTIKQYNLTEI
jgi:hypothetical protein